MHSVLADNSNKRTRGSMISLFTLGSPFASLLIYPLVGWVEHNYGWRWAFIVAGVPGLLIGALIYFTFRDHARETARKTKVPAPPLGHTLRFLFSQRAFYMTLIGYVVSLKLHLRDELGDLSELAPFLPADELPPLRRETNVPVAILQRLSDQLREAYLEGWVHPLHLPLLENQLTTLTDIQGGCERIKNTPIPFSYTVLIHRIVAVYCFTLPFGIVKTTHLMTPLVVALMAYSFLGLDAVGDEIEDPFGRDINDLPLSQLSRMIERNLRQRLGEEELPPAIQPDAKGVLM